MSGCNFRVGQKVVCVDDAARARYLAKGVRPKFWDMSGLRSGEVYTIRDVQVGVHPVFVGPSVWLEEIRRIYEPIIGMEMPFSASRFRPVVEPKTDISIFTRMLTSSPIKEPVA